MKKNILFGLFIALGVCAVAGYDLAIWTDAKVQADAYSNGVLDRGAYIDGTAVTVSDYGKTLVDDVNATTARATLGLGSIATQAANNVAITGGSVSGLAYAGIIMDTNAANTPTVPSLWICTGGHHPGLFVVIPGKTIYPVTVGAAIAPAAP